MRLQDKVAIITGGAEGIGKAYAIAFAKEGAKLVVADINVPAAQALADRLTKQGTEVLATRTDVSKVVDTEEMTKQALERFGRIDVLINNAAKFQRNPAVRAPVWKLDPAEWDSVMAVNLRGVFLCCRAVLPQMMKQKSGKIINIASSLAFSGAAEFSHYSASKGGVLTFSRALAKEVGEHNINVNTLCPGFTLSATPGSQTEERRFTEVSSRILKRAEYPEDLVGAAIFLASSDSDFMTGQALVVDGGLVLN
jgi:3-oxoacyl-[acyl-carrier protein] reductase